MDKKIVKFDDTKIEKHEFYQHRNSILLKKYNY